MIQEMEDTLIEIKASCARTMASQTRVNRALTAARDHSQNWADKAAMALEKGRDDLAREALVEKRNYQEQVTQLDSEAGQLGEVTNQYQADIQQLEEKLEATRQKHQVLVQRHLRARKHHKAQTKIRQANSTDALIRFDQFENRIERMEAAADLVNVSQRPDLDNEFRKMKQDDEIEKELAEMKKSVAAKEPSSPSQA
jgi:phage shock protein A